MGAEVSRKRSQAVGSPLGSSGDHVVSCGTSLHNCSKLGPEGRSLCTPNNQSFGVSPQEISITLDKTILVS